MATQIQAAVSSALQDLMLSPVPSEVCGGPQEFRVTDTAADHLRSLADGDKLLVVDSGGSVSVK